MQNDVVQLYLKQANDLNVNFKQVDVPGLFELLTTLEKKFLKTLRSFKEGKALYELFCRMVNLQTGICSDKRILPTFLRESQDKLIEINKAISKLEMKLVYEIHFNYKFIDWALKSLKDSTSHKMGLLNKLFEEMVVIRKKIIETFIYMGIHLAKISKTKMNSAHYEYADFIQTANEAIIESVDKYVLSRNSKFSHVLQGKILAHLMIHNYTHSSIISLGNYGIKQLQKIKKILVDVNVEDGISNDMQSILSNASKDIDALMLASNYLSLDEPLMNDNYGRELLRMDIIEDESVSHEEKVINNEVLEIILQNINKLSILEKKILILDGVKIYEMHE